VPTVADRAWVPGGRARIPPRPEPESGPWLTRSRPFFLRRSAHDRKGFSPANLANRITQTKAIRAGHWRRTRQARRSSGACADHHVRAGREPSSGSDRPGCPLPAVPRRRLMHRVRLEAWGRCRPPASVAGQSGQRVGGRQPSGCAPSSAPVAGRARERPTPWRSNLRCGSEARPAHGTYPHLIRVWDAAAVGAQYFPTPLGFERGVVQSGDGRAATTHTVVAAGCGLRAAGCGLRAAKAAPGHRG
jgi:hypothetical protein